MSKPNITVNAVSQYVPQQSDSSNGRFVFAYTVTIQNNSDKSYQLLSRHWIIQDGNMKTEEVYGEGVIGEQPVIEPGSEYSYTSGAVLDTDMGTMEGRYFFSDVETSSLQSTNNIEAGEGDIEIPIPKFLLSIPRTVH